MSYGSSMISGFFIAPSRSTSTPSTTRYVTADRVKSPSKSALREKARAAFAELAPRWRNETAYSSSMQQMFSNENYLKIISYGEHIVPAILEDLKAEPDHWYWALKSITGANPAEDAPPGDLEACCEAWVTWGREKGYVD